jgi:hypothetical protein
VFETLEGLQVGVEERLGHIIADPMQWISEHWIEKLNQVINTARGDVEGQFFG